MGKRKNNEGKRVHKDLRSWNNHTYINGKDQALLLKICPDLDFEVMKLLVYY